MKGVDVYLAIPDGDGASRAAEALRSTGHTVTRALLGRHLACSGADRVAEEIRRVRTADVVVIQPDLDVELHVLFGVALGARSQTVLIGPHCAPWLADQDGARWFNTVDDFIGAVNEEGHR